MTENNNNNKYEWSSAGWSIASIRLWRQNAFLTLSPRKRKKTSRRYPIWAYYVPYLGIVSIFGPIFISRPPIFPPLSRVWRLHYHDNDALDLTRVYSQCLWFIFCTSLHLRDLCVNTWLKKKRTIFFPFVGKRLRFTLTHVSDRKQNFSSLLFLWAHYKHPI